MPALPSMWCWPFLCHSMRVLQLGIQCQVVRGFILFEYFLFEKLSRFSPGTFITKLSKTSGSSDISRSLGLWVSPCRLAVVDAAGGVAPTAHNDWSYKHSCGSCCSLDRNLLNPPVAAFVNSLCLFQTSWLYGQGVVPPAWKTKETLESVLGIRQPLGIVNSTDVSLVYFWTI